MKPEPLFREIPWRRPADAFAQFAGEPFALLLESALESGETGRYSFIAVDPFETFVFRGVARALSATRQASTIIPGRSPFDVLGAQLARYPLSALPGLPPFQTGAAGLFGYELNRTLERLPEPRPDDLGFPEMAVGLYDTVVAFDHSQQRAWIVSSGYPEQDGRLRALRARERLEETASRLGAAVDGPAPGELESGGSGLSGRGGERTDGGAAPRDPATGRDTELETESDTGATATGMSGRRSTPAPNREPGPIESNFTPDDYRAMVRRVIEYIRAGDVFQVNLSQRFVGTLAGGDSAYALYLRLRARNAAPFASFFNLGGRQIVSASPERFLALRGARVETRPIKGTRPRAAAREADAAIAAELLASPKDRAENVMIVDLLRNDLSRVCRPGTVEVPALCALESYATVHHLVSTVTGELQAGTTAVELLRAAFPGGSVTGAPKIRAMEIIRELEPHRRGPYCGSVGYIGFNGDMDTSIAIRTFAVAGTRVAWHAGGGIVSDSDPDAEHEESLDKARALREVL